MAQTPPHMQAALLTGVHSALCAAYNRGLKARRTLLAVLGDNMKILKAKMGKQRCLPPADGRPQRALVHLER